MGYGITDIKRFCAGETHVASPPSGERDYFHTVISETHYYRFGKYAYFNLFQYIYDESMLLVFGKETLNLIA